MLLASGGWAAEPSSFRACGGYVAPRRFHGSTEPTPYLPPSVRPQMSERIACEPTARQSRDSLTRAAVHAPLYRARLSEAAPVAETDGYSSTVDAQGVRSSRAPNRSLLRRHELCNFCPQARRTFEVRLAAMTYRLSAFRGGG